MDFKEYFNKPTTITFYFEDTLIIIQEILTEIVGYNYYSTNGKRFKVTFLAPKNRQASHLGHYEPETMYVVANHANEAKEKLYNWLNYQAGFKSKGRQYQLDRSHMQMATRQVTNWKDLKELINYVTSRRMSTTERLNYFGQSELALLTNQANQPNFTKQVERLPSKDQLLIKKLIKDLNVPPNVLAHAKYWGRKYSQQSLPYEHPQPQEERPQYWSVYAPKDEKEHEERIHNIRNAESVKEVVKLANQYGINQKQLFDKYAYDYHSGKNKYFHEDQASSLHKWLRDKMGKNYEWRRVASGDYASLPFSWEALVRQAGETGYDHPLTYLANAMTDDSYGNKGDIEDAFWDFYTQGPPKVVPQAKRLANTLEDMLKEYHEPQRLRAAEPGYDWDKDEEF